MFNVAERSWAILGREGDTEKCQVIQSPLDDMMRLTFVRTMHVAYIGS